MADFHANVADNPLGTDAGQGVVAPQLEPTQPMQEHADPGQWGAVGGAVQKFGNTAEEVSQHYGEMAVHTATNDQFVNGYVPAVSKLTSDFKKLQGMDAVAAQPEYEKNLQDLNKQYMSGGSLMQQQYMGELVRSKAIYSANEIGAYADSQYKAHQTMVTNQSLKNTQDEAVQNFNDPHAVDMQVNRAMGLKKLSFHDENGYDPQSTAIAEQVGNAAGGEVAKRAIQAAIDNNNPQLAQDYFAKYKSILGADSLPVQKQILAANIDVNASQNAHNLLAGNPMVLPGSPLAVHNDTKATVSELAQKENFDPNIANGIVSSESNYGAAITDKSSRKDVFQTDPKLRDKGFEGDDLAASVHNGVKIWNENNTDLTTRLGRPTTLPEGYLAYQQGGAGAHSLLTASPADTAVQALSRIMPYQEAVKHVINNHGTPTMAANDFVQKQEDWWNAHYDTSKTTVADNGNLPAAIRGQTGVQLPAVQPSSNPHQFFNQINDRLPAAQAAADTIPDDALREKTQKQIKSQYEQAKLADTAWKNTQAQSAQQYMNDNRFTNMDQIPQSVKSDFRAAGQYDALERSFKDKMRPSDNTYGAAGFMRSMGRMASDDPTDSISDLASLQKTYADSPDLHSSGFKTLQKMIQSSSTPEGKATIAGQYQYLSELQQKMLPAQFESALPKFFAGYGDAQTKGTLSDFLSLDSKNSRSFAASLNLPSSQQLTGAKIQHTTSWLSSLFGDEQKAALPSNPTGEKILKDFDDGKITEEQKNTQLTALGITPSTVPKAQ